MNSKHEELTASPQSIKNKLEKKKKSFAILHPDSYCYAKAQVGREEHHFRSHLAGSENLLGKNQWREPVKVFLMSHEQHSLSFR